MFSAAISAEEEANSERVCTAAAGSLLAFERSATFSKEAFVQAEEISADFMAASKATADIFSPKAAWVLNASSKADISTGNLPIMSLNIAVISGVCVMCLILQVWLAV